MHFWRFQEVPPLWMQSDFSWTHRSVNMKSIVLWREKKKAIISSLTHNRCYISWTRTSHNEMEFLNETILFRLLRSSRVRNLRKLSRKVNTLSKEKTIAEINFAKLIYNKFLCNRVLMVLANWKAMRYFLTREFLSNSFIILPLGGGQEL